ncbi:hypothetical protein LASUN_00510 [Lentilactobacillus sunkii]|uniref:Uncharacterized protein n=1 Tax=Lentilactobacillus sunkii TaxID=481719 RepID=A0A1E7XJ91_9LACO|nr:hypothetical protein [Lentilactobacillus sunkii]OFA13052.1 hypothetical protein LASUN_00510 [Lentilactobacillus sunkii]
MKKIKTIQVLLNNFKFEKTNNRLKSQNDQSLSFSKVDAPQLNLDKNETAMAANTELAFSTNKFSTTGNVTGIFIVSKKKADAIVSGNDLDAAKELTSTIVPILMSKFRLYTAMFSTEANTYPIIPEFKVNANGLQLDKKNIN